MANTVCKEVEAFGWRVRDKTNEVIKITLPEKRGQILSNKGKTVLKLIGGSFLNDFTHIGRFLFISKINIGKF